ncbi:preprotein translocase subunit SecE [Candidatus Zinderia endosymbiont of Aphrophora alni]|uniref:preprotein translocase subunit SecE n=1 Tax=Candidatus Zinderia endosymbiont of Aphrophora alni TaxID=3077951 RepID=UPI0030D122B7
MKYIIFFFNFLKKSFKEFKKIIWPTFFEVIEVIIVVILFCIFMFFFFIYSDKLIKNILCNIY